MLLSLLTTGCLETPRTLPEVMGAQAWTFGETSTDGLGVAWARYHSKTARGPAHVYVEGDGRAYVARGHASGNPTPSGFGAWQLAQADAADGPAEVIYLGRPCQFVDLRRYPACNPDAWTMERFSAAQQAALQAALSQLVPGEMLVIGYSGGAVHALALAQNLASVAGVVTVAGNLSPKATNAWHQVSEQPHALEPLQTPGRLEDIPVLHVTGGDDTVIPPALLAQVLEAAPALPCTATAQVAEAGHRAGWQGWWQQHAAGVFSAMAQAAAQPVQDPLQKHTKACKKPAVGE